MLSGNIFILILGAVCIIIFLPMLRIKASKNQLNRDKRPNFSWYWSKNSQKKEKTIPHETVHAERIIEGKAEDISEENDSRN